MRSRMLVTAAAVLSTIAIAGVAQNSGAPVKTVAKYGALAVDRAKGFAFGFAYDHPTRAAANAFALEECKKRGGLCATVVEFSGAGCAAYRTISETDGTAYGWGLAANREAAESRAASECADFADGKVCGNHVWSCNSGDAPFKSIKSEPVRPLASKTDCLVQAELQVEEGDDWRSRFYSPVYRYAAKDCPLPGKSAYHGYSYYLRDNGQPSVSEVNEDRKNPAQQKRGFAWTQDFYEWSVARPSPFAGYTLRQVGSLTVSDATPSNVTDLVSNVGEQDAGDSRGIAVGACIGYVPPGATPVAVLGKDQCQRWFR